MARTEQREIDPAPPAPAAPAPLEALSRPPEVPKPPRRRLSTGHVVMIVAGLVAALLSYSVLRSAGGSGTEVLVAARAIPAGATAGAADFRTTSIKAPAGTITSGMVTPAGESSLAGQVAAVAIPAGQLIEESDFAPATPEPPSMGILVDPAAIPGGLAALRVGATIDLIGTHSVGPQSGQPAIVPGLQVLKVPPAAPPALGSSPTVQIDVAVPSLLTAAQVDDVTASGKFEIRVTGPSGSASGSPGAQSPASGAPGSGLSSGG
jgi:hypothetical protein